MPTAVCSLQPVPSYPTSFQTSCPVILNFLFYQKCRPPGVSYPMKQIIYQLFVPPGVRYTKKQLYYQFSSPLEKVTPSTSCTTPLVTLVRVTLRTSCTTPHRPPGVKLHYKVPDLQDVISHFAKQFPPSAFVLNHHNNATVHWWSCFP